MSDGSPSLEDDLPRPLLETENVYIPKPKSPLFVGSPVKFQRKRPSFDLQETESFLQDARRNEIAIQNLFRGDDLPSKEDKIEELKSVSVISMYDMDNLSKEMDTTRDNASDTSTNAMNDFENEYYNEELPTIVETNHSLSSENGKSTHCSVLMSGAAHNKSLYFNDGVRSVDFVLVWESQKDCARTPEAQARRRIFEQNLESDGLELEREAPDELFGLSFVKIHAPTSVLRDYSEILKLRMPMKASSRIQKGGRMNAIMNAAMYMSKFSALKDVHVKTNNALDKLEAMWNSMMSHIRVDADKFPERKTRLTAIYSKDKEYLFDTNAPCFWTPSIRSRVVQFILDRKRFSNDPHNDYAFGIERLTTAGVYSAAYPLHDGDLKTPGSMRYLLYKEWASVSKCLRYQPLDYIKDYFGVKIGLYFAWLGFYTHMLIPASLVGLVCFIYSLCTIYSFQPSNDICNDNSPIKMCPLCDFWCDYWDLKETCVHSRITYLFDNPTTVFFAIFMSFWAALFLELWKRYSAEMTHRWDLTGFDIYEENPRPQYLARLAHVKRTQLNVVTGVAEPMVPFWRMRLPATLLSFSVVCLLVLLAAAVVLGVVLYRMSLLVVLAVQRQDSLITSNAILFTTATAAFINLCLICVFNYLYQFLAKWLTEKELLRTQTEFDDSLTLKIYLLQFVNYYASIFYIAFFKGKFVGRPGKYYRMFQYRQEECGPGGCLMELAIQLSIIMIGKQAFNTVVEMLLPYMYKWLNIIRTIGRKKRIHSPLQWVKDFKMVDFGHMGLFPEYLEMVLQYGFVTIFVAAFPLAPLFALLNNVLEMRLDAVKLLTCYRRPVPQRVSDIGVWYRILDSIGKLSIITNGFIIAFTSDFIPRLVYRMSISDNGTLEGYMNHTLTEFNVTLLAPSGPRATHYNQATCRFPGYWSQDDMGAQTNLFWHILGARLAFVVVFENVVVLVMIIVKWAIPDMSGDLRDRIRREAYIINTFILEETKARSQRTPGSEATPKIHNLNHLLSESITETDFDLACHGFTNSTVNRHNSADVIPTQEKERQNIKHSASQPLNVNCNAVRSLDRSSGIARVGLDRLRPLTEGGNVDDVDV